MPEEDDTALVFKKGQVLDTAPEPFPTCHPPFLTPPPPHTHLFFFFNFYWRIVDLQCCVPFQVYSKVNQLYIYIYALFFRFFSHTGHYYRVLSRVPYATQ